jgi:anaerobic magnesium-protoporphyrin IX monomethyl ester cyclase
MTDCLIIGFNDVDFNAYVTFARSMGRQRGAFRDLNLAFLTHEQRHYRSLDLLTKYHSDGRGDVRPFSNVDFLWPVVAYLYTFLTRRGFNADYVNLFQREKNELIEKLKTGNVRTVAITTTLYVSAMPVAEIIELVRKYSKTTKIIVGGPFIHNQFEAMDSAELQRFCYSLGADIYVVSPEGESTLVRVLEALREGRSLAGIDNLLFRDGKAIVQTGMVPEANSLPENMIDYSLFPQRHFGGFVNLRTAKSCPFSCAFCAFPSRAGKYTYLPIDLVEKELDAIADLGERMTLTFLDDTFNVPKERFKEIMRLMIRKQYGFKWNSFLRSDHADDEAIELMGRSGCEGVFLGVESGSDRILKAMNKTSRRSDYLRVIPKLRSAGMLTHASVIVGYPGETLESVHETMDLIETARPTFYRAQLWYCDPTTPVWRRRAELGIRGAAFNWAHPSMDAETAINLVDRFFLDIRGSTWLPQYGFELWSVFYLQRRGMTLEQVLCFVRAFNAGVRAKLENPAVQDVPPALLQSIRDACHFQLTERVDTVKERQARPSPAIAESGIRYMTRIG